MFSRIQEYVLNERLFTDTWSIANGESISSWMDSVSPSNEAPYQEFYGLPSDELCDKSSNSRLSMMKDGVSRQTNNGLPNISSHVEKCEFSNTSSRKCLQQTTPNTAFKSCTNTARGSMSTPCKIPPSKELIALIEQQKVKLCKEFLDWKAALPKYFGNRQNLLCEVFRVQLNSLKEGKYLFGSDFFINIAQAAKDSTYIGIIQSEGRSGKKYVVIPGRKPVELNLGYVEDVTELLTIKVHSTPVLSIYNKAKPSFQKVCAGPSDLTFDYNPRMIFVGNITSDQRFMVNILGQDVEFDLDIFPNGCQVLYSDHLAKKQKIFSYRVVGLTVLTENFALVDFNYSYACNIAGKFQPKFIDLLIPAGANPYYF
ncbi:hypothetical protein HK103_004435 [Boothiomyces macroporosus]|uniref:Uncharacterized protein n=1 Tax=Boothiomyces macroporosus TaxID=261099 RepID=A0AAD5UJ54_9FUNG|nr:hypothetical protein HK103_004435 [Boothiomyces macroporosus]